MKPVSPLIHHATGTAEPIGPTAELPDWPSVLFVVAQPDDLCLLLAGTAEAFARAGTTVDVLCYTHGESTWDPDLPCTPEQATDHLRNAVATLGGRHLTQLDYAQDTLVSLPVHELIDPVLAQIDAHEHGGIVIIDPAGSSDDKDHTAAARATLHAAQQRGIHVLSWVITDDIAHLAEDLGRLSPEGHSSGLTNVACTVDRAAHTRALEQLTCRAPLPPPFGRLLRNLGATDHLRWLTQHPDRHVPRALQRRGRR